jgi:DNA-binding transcriptional MerR regulator
MMAMTSYEPAEASKHTGLSLDTLRYYERLGLFGPVDRTAGGRRIYSEGDLAWIQLLVCLRRAGLGITHLQTFMGMLRNGSTSSGSVVDLLENHRAELGTQLAQMQTALRVLDEKIAYYRARDAS